MNDRAGRGVLLVGVSAIVLVAVVAGFLALGTPQDERRRRFDERRLSDLMTLRTAVVEHFDRTGALPATLEALSPPEHRATILSDPATGKAYGYEAFEDSSFRLCATFDEPSDPQEGRSPFDPWVHSDGYTCYEFRLGRRRPSEVLPWREPEPVRGP